MRLSTHKQTERDDGCSQLPALATHDTIAGNDAIARRAVTADEDTLAAGYGICASVQDDADTSCDGIAEHTADGYDDDGTRAHYAGSDGSRATTISIHGLILCGPVASLLQKKKG